jgi:hypothetical protein
MFLSSRRQAAERAQLDALVTVVRPFDHRTRRALYGASNRASLRRHTWDGCALNRAADELGLRVSGQTDAVDAFGATRLEISDFIRAWDSQRGSTARCTARLRDAILEVGLFPPDGAGDIAEAAGDRVLGTSDPA